VEALANALEANDEYTSTHARWITDLALRVGRGLDLDESSLKRLELGALLHDIGKIGIPDNILRKRGPLTQRERSLLETHTLLGEQMLGGVPLLAGGGITIVRSHHERWDGSGYPDQLAGPEIPLGARVFAIADALDAMTSDRPYRAALGWDAAVAEIASQSGRQFDPEAVEAFGEQEPSLRRIYYELTAV
jgi:HD-GYP domain-containing protein (c-di-GMP phosphodiesterase class II)